jgi:hypothetical protein
MQLFLTDTTSRRGQSKPQGLPRINWSHPLAKKLVTYVYDCNGIFIDLVNGGQGVITTSTTNVVRQSSKFGTGLKFGNTATSACVTMPVRSRVSALGTTDPWSAAIGCMPVATPPGNSAIAVICDGSNNTGPAFYQSTANYLIYWANGASSSTTAANTFSQNVYHTCLLSASAASVASIYCDGKLDQTNATANIATIAGSQLCINTGAAGSLNGTGGAAGFVYYFAGWQRALTAAEARQLHDDPYCFLIFPEDELWATWVGAAGGPSGPLVTTEAQDVAAFAGDVVVSGALATTEATDTAAFVGNVLVSGALATTESADTPALAGFVGVSGALATTEAQDVVAFAGTITTTVSGALATTEAQDVAAFAGAVLVSGVLATTEAKDQAAFAGSVLVSGAWATTEATDVAAFSGSVIVAGSLATTEATDAAAFAGFVGVSGSLATTEAKDVAAFAGSVLVSGALITTEATDVAAFAGFVGVSGALASTEGQDIAAFAGSVISGIAGSLATTEAPDHAAFAGNVVIAAALAAIEAQDHAAFAGDVVLRATLVTTEAQDTAAFVGIILPPISAILAVTEPSDSARFTVDLAVFVGELHFGIPHVIIPRRW